MKTMSKSKLERKIDVGITTFFYGKIIQSLLKTEEKLVIEENFEGAAVIRDEILELKEEFNKEINNE